MNLKSFNCPNCGASLEPLDDARFMYCQYCGTKIVMDDIEYYRENSKTQREKIRANKEVRKVEVKSTAEVEKKRLEKEEDANLLKMTGLILLGLAIFLILIAFL